MAGLVISSSAKLVGDELVKFGDIVYHKPLVEWTMEISGEVDDTNVKYKLNVRLVVEASVGDYRYEKSLVLNVIKTAFYKAKNILHRMFPLKVELKALATFVQNEAIEQLSKVKREEVTVRDVSVSVELSGPKEVDILQALKIVETLYNVVPEER